MKKHTSTQIITLLVGLFISVSVFSQEKPVSTNDKIDSIYYLQKQMYGEQKNNPLFDKKLGVEFNFIRLVYMKDFLQTRFDY